MLIYTTENHESNHYTEPNLDKSAESTDILKIESLKLAIKTLSEFHIPNLKHEGSELDLFTAYNFENEDLEAHYITVIKYLTRSLEPNVLNTLYNASQKDFPVLGPLQEYSHHSDVMIRNAARISLMTIFQNCCGEAMEYITSVTMPQHINDIITHLKQHALDIQHFYETWNGTALENIYLCYREELEYVDDILSLGYSINNLVISRVFNEFIVPFILTAITYEQNIEHISLISCRIGLYLLSKLFGTITNTKLKDYMVTFFLQEETMEETLTCTDISHKSINQMIKPSQLIAPKYEMDIDRLYILQILNILHLHISGDSMKSLKFYNKFLYTFIQFFMQNKYFTNHNLHYTKLKLLTSILEPLMGKAIVDDQRWRNLQIFFPQALEILYSDICTKIKQEVTNLEAVIDEEYEIFTHAKLDIERILENVNYLIQIEDYKNFDTTVNNRKFALWDLFHVRYLYLKYKSEKEKILPILRRKEEIGKILSVDNCIPCEKLTHDNNFKNKHFIQLTDRQLLIIQSTQLESQGIVVFNSYYRDIFWSMDVNNTIKIYEVQKYHQFQFEMTSEPFFIQLKLGNKDDLHFIQNFLLRAKSMQVKITKNKLKNLLQVKDTEMMPNFETKNEN